MKRKVGLGVLGVVLLVCLVCPAFVGATENPRGEVGFTIQLQPYIEAPADEVILDVYAFNNGNGNIPIIFKELELFYGQSTVPFKTVKVNEVLKTLKEANLSTNVIEELIFPHPLQARKFPGNREGFFQTNGDLVLHRLVTIKLGEIAPKLAVNDSLQIRATGTFINGGKPQVLSARSESTYMAPLNLSGPDGFSTLADSYNGWYRVDAHFHTNWSDGNATIAEGAQAAKNAGLATLIITDHGDQFDPASSHYKNLGSWQDQRNYILNNTFALPITNGEEVTEDPEFLSSSHYLAYDLKSWVYNGIHYNYGGSELYNPNEQPLVDAVNANNAPYSIGGPAHPDHEIYAWNGMEESGMGFLEVFDVIGGMDNEALNMWDDWNARHLTNILNGTEKFMAATANSDGHSATDAGKYSTYFYAPNGVTSASNFFNALRERKVVASQTPSFGHWTLNGSPMSSIIDITSGQALNFTFTHLPRGSSYNYVSRVIIVLVDGTNNPRNIQYSPSETSITSTYTIRPGDSLYPTQSGFYRVSFEFRHKNYSWWISNYSWTICQPIFFRLH